MKAARLEDGTLHIRDVPIPVPGPDEALVRISASGVCHSDLHIVRGDWAGVPRSGVLGHEAIGVVEALGPGAERFVEVGDRVILGLGGTGGGYWCGACEYCLEGEPRHCAQAKGVMGTFAEYFSVYAPALVEAARQRRRPRSAARVRWPHRLRRGEEAAQAPRAARAARSRSSAPPAGSVTTRCRSPPRSGTRWSVSTSARSASSSCDRSGAHSRSAPTKRSRSCSESSAASTPASSSRRGWRASASA